MGDRAVVKRENTGGRGEKGEPQRVYLQRLEVVQCAEAGAQSRSRGSLIPAKLCARGQSSPNESEGTQGAGR